MPLARSLLRCYKHRMAITVHGVLAGAYKGKKLEARALLTHASADGGTTALCGTIKADSLCDEVLDETPSCTRCARKAVRS